MSDMQQKPSFDDLTLPSDETVADAGYDAWKRAKIEAALEEAKDRSTLIPLEQVWKRFGFER